MLLSTSVGDVWLSIEEQQIHSSKDIKWGTQGGMCVGPM